MTGPNKRRLAGLLALVLAPAAPARGDDFAARRQRCLDAARADFQQHAAKPSAKNAFWRAAALFELGMTAEGRVLAHRGLDALAPGNRENRWIYGGNTNFDAWPGLDCYIRYEKHLDDATKRRFRETYTGGAFYQRLSTSNHKIMAAVSRYLATQIWGPDAFHPHPFYSSDKAKPTHNGFDPLKAMRFEEKDPTGEQYIRAMCDEVPRSGPGEYASRPYGAANLLPLLSIAECARDPDLRRRAAMAYEVALIQLAPAYQRGHLATFSPRSYPDTESQRPRGLAATLWPYFGGVEPASLHDHGALRVATSRHPLPPLLAIAGTDRAKPYTYRSLINRWALNHSVRPGHTLFSRSPKAAAKGFQGQSYPCGVMWEEPDANRGSHLWITHPAADEPGKMGIHTHGVTGHDRQLLHRDALLFVFDIPADHRHPYVLGYLPGGHRTALATDDRIFLHYGSVLVAVSSTAPHRWDPRAGIRAPASPPRPGDSEFRVMETRAALALETAAPDEFPAASPDLQLAAFRDAVLAKSRIALDTRDGTTGRYRDRHGNLLECAFAGDDRINGKPVDYAAWPVLESPWTRQPGPDGPLVLTDGTRRRTYDFKTHTVRDSP